MELIILVLLCIQKWCYERTADMEEVIGTIYYIIFYRCSENTNSLFRITLAYIHTQREFMEKREKVAEEVIESYMESALQRLKQEHQKSIQ